MKMTQKTFKISTLAVLVVAFALVPQIASAQVKIVSTLGDLAAVAEEVGGAHVEVKLLASPHEDPHFVDAKPSFVKELAGADLLAFNGMSLEAGWLPTLVKGSRNAKLQSGAAGSFDASAFIDQMGVPTAEITRAAGDVHPEGNPHYSPDPRQMARVALALGKRLGEVDPAHAESYKSRARAFAKKALTSANKWRDKFAALPQSCRDVAVYHESWPYITDWLGLDAVIAIEPKPGVPPNPRHVVKVFKTMKQKDVHAILHLEYYPNTTAKMIAQKTGATLISVAGQTRADQDYLTRVDKLAGGLYSALKGGCE
jgi:zinc/manganese transport system substrate-binding protein